MKHLRIIAFLVCLFPLLAGAQASRYDGTVYTVNQSAPLPGAMLPVLALSGATVQVCSTWNTSGCTVLLQTYQSTTVSLGNECPTTAQLYNALTSSCSATADVSGGWGIWAAAGSYAYFVTTSYGTYGPYPFGIDAAGVYLPSTGGPLGPFGYAPDGKVDPRNPAFAGGAVADMAIAGIGVNVSVSGSTVTAVSSVFTPANVGKVMIIQGAGPGNGAFTGAISGTTLTISAGAPPTAMSPGSTLYDAGPTLAFGTQIVSGSGSSYVVNISQTVGSESMTAQGFACIQTVASYTSGTQVSLNSACATNVSGQKAYLGTDNTVALQAAATYAKANGIDIYIATVPGQCFLVTGALNLTASPGLQLHGDAGPAWATTGRSAICHALTLQQPVTDLTNSGGAGFDGVTIVPPGYNDYNSHASAVYFTSYTGTLINGQTINNSYLQGGSCDTCATVVDWGGDQFHIKGSTLNSLISPAAVVSADRGTATSVTSPFVSGQLSGNNTLTYFEGGNQFVGGGSNEVVQTTPGNGHVYWTGDNYVQGVSSPFGGQKYLVDSAAGAVCFSLDGIRTESYNSTPGQSPLYFPGGMNCGSVHGIITGNGTGAAISSYGNAIEDADINILGTGVTSFLNLGILNQAGSFNSTFHLAGSGVHFGSPGISNGSSYYLSNPSGNFADNLTTVLNDFPDPLVVGGGQGDQVCMGNQLWSPPYDGGCYQSDDDIAYYGPAPTGSQFKAPKLRQDIYQTVAGGSARLQHGIDTDSTTSLIDYVMGETPDDSKPINFNFTKAPAGSIVTLPVASIQSNAGFFSGLVTNWLPNSNNFSASTWQVTGGVTPTINAACGANCTDQYGNPATEISWSALGNLTDVATGGCGSNCTNITANVPYVIQINAKVATAPQAFEVGVANAGNVLNLTTSWATYCLPIASSGSVNLSYLGAINNNQIGAGAQTIYVSNNVTVSQGNSCTGALPTGNVQQLTPIAVTESPSYIITTLTPSTSPVCPNGTNGALTTSGCSGGGGVASVSVSVPSFAVPANTCYGSSGSATPATFTMTGATTSMALLPGWTGNPAAYTGYGTTGGLAFDAWVSAADTGSYVICNPTAAPITGSAISFIVAAK